MKKSTKVTRLPKVNSAERRLKENFDLTDRIRENGIYDLRSLTENFQHLSLVVESVQRNYQALLSENRRLKLTLLGLVNECYCWEENRCDRCQKILNLLTNEPVNQKPDAVQQYQTILQQLRKLG